MAGGVQEIRQTRVLIRGPHILLTEKSAGKSFKMSSILVGTSCNLSSTQVSSGQKRNAQVQISAVTLQHDLSHRSELAGPALAGREPGTQTRAGFPAILLLSCSTKKTEQCPHLRPKRERRKRNTPEFAAMFLSMLMLRGDSSPGATPSTCLEGNGRVCLSFSISRCLHYFF